MSNLRMEEKIRNHEAIDLADYQRDGNYYLLRNFIEDMDYCDTVTERWIWSIGRRKSDGAILASTTAEFYQNPAFDCLWLR